MMTTTQAPPAKVMFRALYLKKTGIEEYHIERHFAGLDMVEAARGFVAMADPDETLMYIERLGLARAFYLPKIYT